MSTAEAEVQDPKFEENPLPPVGEKPAKNKSQYFVYQQNDPGDTLILLATVEAANDLAAIQVVNAKSPLVAGVYVAIAKRNLRCRNVEVDTSPRVVIS